MGWKDWVPDVFGGGESKEKVEEASDGTSKIHYIRNDDANNPEGRKDHSHIVLEVREDGSTKSAHATGKKSQRS